MYKTSFRVSLFLIILFLPSVLFAAGLGKLSLMSALGQPLSAEIDIVTANKSEIPSLRASIASQEAFAQAGIQYEPFFSTVKVSVESRVNGNPYIKLSSPQAINDPFLNLLVELNWASGRILREYAVLLDPAESSPQQVTAPSVASPVVAAPQQNKLTESEIPKKIPPKDKQAPPTENNSSAYRTTGTYGPVVPGDNLSVIARQVLPAGVDLNQMLVALYRANRDAFIAGNMNLLRVGAVLKIPEKSEADAIDKKSANSEIRVQVVDWQNYRSRLASSSRDESSRRTIRQSDQGKITTRIEKQATSSNVEPKEVLRLSSALQTDGNKDSAAPSNVADRLRMMEEDAIAKNLSLKEANERVAMLEKSVENLKKLLELKDATLAQAQVRAESTGKVATEPEIRPEAVIAQPPQQSSVQLQQDSESVTENDQVDVTIPDAGTTPTEQSAPVEAVMPASLPLPVSDTNDEEMSLTDQIFANIEYVGAFLMVALLSALLWVRKRRQNKEDDDKNDKAAEGFSSRMKSRMAAMSGAQQVAAADGYAESSDEDSTYQSAASAEQSNEEDQDFEQNTVLYANLPEKSDAAEFDSQLQIDSENNETKHSHQSRDIDLTDDGINTDVHPVQVNYETEFDLSDANESVQNDQVKIDSSDYESVKDLEVGETVLNFDSVTESNTDQSNTIDFDFSEDAINLADDAIQNAKLAKSDKASAPNHDHPSALELMDEPSISEQFDSDEVDTTSKVIPIVPELGLESINLDIESADSVAQKDKESDLSENSEQWQEVETKLDLAKAYQEMDDKEGAKEMLEEVIRDGDAKQKRAAKKLMKSL
ncbi:pilus assembly protein FimV [Nitrosomonas sp. PY1]|uniref:FimV/HubP family polar landmark protein n=1 Tax=Nitrosomonas sp. PY1 TaxID=1803906 RepID=UPI001FC82EBE|nr:FimV/HubP family polar landmark protein [Nitrosomonas sp. PY1]GKS69857.1 pilus assembly protein FimV [Nitrosomonas sp. PY1]